MFVDAFVALSSYMICDGRDTRFANKVGLTVDLNFFLVRLICALLEIVDGSKYFLTAAYVRKGNVAKKLFRC